MGSFGAFSVFIVFSEKMYLAARDGELPVEVDTRGEVAAAMRSRGKDPSSTASAAVNASSNVVVSGRHNRACGLAHPTLVVLDRSKWHVRPVCQSLN